MLFEIEAYNRMIPTEDRREGIRCGGEPDSRLATELGGLLQITLTASSKVLIVP